MRLNWRFWAILGKVEGCFSNHFQTFSPIIGLLEKSALPTDRWTDRRTDGRTDGQTDGQTLLERCVEASKKSPHTLIWTDRQTNRQTDRQTAWQTDRTSNGPIDSTRLKVAIQYCHLAPSCATTTSLLALLLYTKVRIIARIVLVSESPF